MLKSEKNEFLLSPRLCEILFFIFLEFLGLLSGVLIEIFKYKHSVSGFFSFQNEYFLCLIGAFLFILFALTPSRLLIEDGLVKYYSIWIFLDESFDVSNIKNFSVKNTMFFGNKIEFELHDDSLKPTVYLRKCKSTDKLVFDLNRLSSSSTNTGQIEVRSSKKFYTAHFFILGIQIMYWACVYSLKK
jgi:hypothetical protein